MATTLYRWDDASAPALTGTADSIITVLDAILVNGYGAKAAAGWTKAYTGVGKVAYRMASTAGKAGYYVRIVDNGDTNRSFQYRMYKTMSDVDTGTNPTPTVAQVGTNGFYVAKSQTSDSTARPWICVADDTAFVFFCDSNTTSYPESINYHSFMCCGQGTSRIGTLDTDFVVCLGRTNTTLAATAYATAAYQAIGTSTSADGFTYCASNAAGSLGSISGTRRYFGWHSGPGTNLIGDLSYGQVAPDPVTGGINLSPVTFFEVSTLSFGIPRGYIPFLYAPDHAMGGTRFHDTRLTGSGDLAGKEFLFLNAGRGAGNTSVGCIAVQISGAR
ncbi:MAG TPA: hypothetical protein P5539_05705 [Mesotoga sp.]|nr:hypothetical protein [Mesotoga sp.]